MKNEEEWQELEPPNNISGAVLIDGIKVYNYYQYMEMSPAYLELCPWLHLDRGAKNKEKWEEWLSLRTLLECSGIL